jgi:hypothetical protein
MEIGPKTNAPVHTHGRPHAPDLESSGTVVDSTPDELGSRPKRKHILVNYAIEDLDYGIPHKRQTTERSGSSPKIQGVLIGVWCDSDQAKDADKHDAGNRSR